MAISRRVQLNKNYLITPLAIVFVVYHLSQVVMVPLNFKPSPATNSPTPVVQHKTTDATAPKPSIQANTTKLGVQVNQDQWPTQVIMPSVDIDLLLQGSIEETGSWQISETGANFALNTAIPNLQSGNTVLFGHDRPQLFRNIHELKPGDSIYLTTAKGTFVYSMMESTIVDPSNVAIMNQTSDAILTLITCDGWLSQNRYVAIAKLSHFTPTPTVSPTKLALR